MEKPPKLREYDGKGDLNKHIQLFNDRINYFSVNKAYKSKLFLLPMVGPSTMVQWPSKGEHGIMMNFCKWFSLDFTVGKRMSVMVSVLSRIVKGKKKTM